VLNQILLGDCLEVLRTLPDESVDSIVTDPPYGLGTHEPTVDEILLYLQGSQLNTGGDFMGHDWFIPSPAVWRECYRVLKPGGHLLSFGGTRTFDLISLGLRAAGFENRDTVASQFGVTTLQWVHGQGFPKSLNVGKTLDKMAGAERKVIGRKSDPRYQYEFRGTSAAPMGNVDPRRERQDHALLTEPATEEAKQWEGYGTALKPSWEPILVFRKPLEKPTVAENVLEHGTGAYNIDACRIGKTGGMTKPTLSSGEKRDRWDGNQPVGKGAWKETGGRWPANLILTHAEECKVVGTKKVQAPVINRFTDGMKPFGDGAGHEYEQTQTGDEEGMEEISVYECVDGCPVKMLDKQSGWLHAHGNIKDHKSLDEGMFGRGNVKRPKVGYVSDAGGASRFFGQIQPDAPFKYAGKVSPKERSGWLTKNKPEFPFVALRENLSEEEKERVFTEWPDHYNTNPEDIQPQNYIPEELQEFFELAPEDTNPHPTMKPLKLIEWLVKLVTPKDAVVLDPYCGSGTTCIAALASGCNYIGIEKDTLFHEIANKRVELMKPELEIRAEDESQQQAFELMLGLGQEEKSGNHS